MAGRGPAQAAKRDLAARGSKLAADRPDDLELQPMAPSEPAGLSKEAAAEWARIVPPLQERGVLATVDRAALVILCESWAEICEIDGLIKAIPEFSMDKRRLMTAKHESFMRWQSLAQRFGLTPADRPRVKIGSGQDKSKKKDDGTARAAFLRVVGS